MGSIVPTILFAIAMTATPGPNNVILTASGARFGFKLTLPALLGIIVGVLSQLALTALGVGALFTQYPVLEVLLKICGVGYLLYLGYRIIAGQWVSKDGNSRGKPLSFIEGALFQYLNPKAWVMTLTAMSVYTTPGPEYALSALVIGTTFLAVMPVAQSAWALFGTFIGRYMTDGRSSVAIRWALGCMTGLSGLLVLV